MSPNAERYAEADEMAAWAASNPQRFAPIRIEPPAHAPARALTLSTQSLLAEVDDGLAMRVCRQQTTARDVLLVQAMTARLRSMVMRPTNREVLDGMLLVDIPDEVSAVAPRLTFDRAERRHA